MDHNEIAKSSISQSLSWTHYIRLMRISNPKGRTFYENEAKFDVTQDVTQETGLDQWIEYQIAANPKITTYELAELSRKTLIEQGRVRSTGIKAATKYACKK